ncbi:hypothetical protein ACFVJ5_05930 [Nocardia sp. NPDC127606]|uniref:hypothetical protein n=1 Tax=Nocardia sp. NPDC127606 TaxID=3345406 RepID=UPI00363FE8E9
MQPTMPSNVERGQRGQCARVLADAFTDDAIWNELRPRSTRGEAKGVGVAEMCEILGRQVREPVDLGYGHSVAPVAWAPGDRAVLR